jgi:hypothetical protein
MVECAVVAPAPRARYHGSAGRRPLAAACYQPRAVRLHFGAPSVRCTWYYSAGRPGGQQWRRSSWSKCPAWAVPVEYGAYRGQPRSRPMPGGGGAAMREDSSMAALVARARDGDKQAWDAIMARPARGSCPATRKTSRTCRPPSARQPRPVLVAERNATRRKAFRQLPRGSQELISMLIADPRSRTPTSAGNWAYRSRASARPGAGACSGSAGTRRGPLSSAPGP